MRQETRRQEREHIYLRELARKTGQWITTVIEGGIQGATEAGWGSFGICRQ